MNGMKEAYTTQELAPLLGMTRQGVDCRAKREGWQSRPRAGRGGGREWLVDSMPESTRLAIAAKEWMPVLRARFAGASVAAAE